MRYLLYGGLGFIGANVAEQLTGEVYVAHRPGSPGRKPIIAEFLRGFAQLVEYRDPRSPLELVRPDVVINLVGEFFGPPEALREANAEFPKLLCEAARAVGWRGKIVHISAATVRGPVGRVIREEDRHLEGVESITAFDKYKAEGERVIASCFNDWVIVRPTLVYGRFNDHPEWVALVKLISKGVAPAIRAEISAISVRELAKAVKSAVDISKEYFFATECQPRPLWYFISAMVKALGKRPLVVPTPRALLRLFAPRELKPHLSFLGRAFSCEKMRRLLGITPQPNFEGEVEEMVQYIESVQRVVRAQRSG